MSSTASFGARTLRIIAPSFLSGLMALLAAAAVIFTVLTPFFYKGSYLEQYGELLQRSKGGPRDIYAFLTRELNSNELVGNIVIFCVWAIVGFALYYLVLSLLSLIVDIVRFANLLGYEKSEKRTIIIEASERLITRIFGVVGLAAFVIVSLEILIPGILTVIAASFSSPLLFSVLYIIASVLFLATIFHVVVVLLRVIFLRTRLIFRIYSSTDS